MTAYFPKFENMSIQEYCRFLPKLKIIPEKSNYLLFLVSKSPFTVFNSEPMNFCT